MCNGESEAEFLAICARMIADGKAHANDRFYAYRWGRPGEAP